MGNRENFGKPKNDGSKARQRDIKREAIKCILNDFLQGATNSVIVEKLTNDDYNIGFKYTKYSAIKLIIEARKILQIDFNNEVAGMKERIFNMILDTYTDARELHNHQSALKAIEMINKMFGLNEPEKQEMTLKSTVIDFGFESNE